MTAVDMTPYWSAAEDWTGFLLVIVPTGPLPVPRGELHRLVRAQLDTDAVLYDLVTVALAPPFEPTIDWDRGFLTSVIEGAMPDRHFFAPRGVLGIVVVASQDDALNGTLGDLKTFIALRQLGVRLFGVMVRPDARAGISPNSVVRIANVATRLIEMYEEDSATALDERLFLDRINAMITEHGLILPGIEPEPVADPLTEQPIHVVLEGDGPVIEAAAAQLPTRPPPEEPPTVEAHQPEAMPTPQFAPATVPAPTLQTVTSDTRALPTARPDQSTPPAVPPSASRARPRVETVMYDGPAIVAVDQRTPMQKLWRQNPTDGDALDALLRDGRAVALVYLVFVPDDGVVSRQMTRRRNAIALELDQAFSSVDLDAISGLPAHVAVEVFSATNPVQKHGVLRSAGELTEIGLPKVDIEYFSVSETLDPLLDGAKRTSRGIQARGIEVMSVHYVFLASMRFPVDESTADDWMRLLERARVTWIDFGPPDRRQLSYPFPSSLFGLHVLTDKEDVVAVVKRHSEVLYDYATPPNPGSQTSPADDQHSDRPRTDGRRWWPFEKRATE